MLLRQGRRKHLKLGRARHFEGMFLLKKRGHFLKMKRALLCLLQNLGRARAPSVPPVPTSMKASFEEDSIFDYEFNTILSFSELELKCL